MELHSPFKQSSFAGKALFREVNRAFDDWWMRLKQHRWIKRKFRVRNVLVMVGASPREQSKYVKLLRADRLRDYIEQFPKVLDTRAVDTIAEWLRRSK